MAIKPGFIDWLGLLNGCQLVAIKPGFIDRLGLLNGYQLVAIKPAFIDWLGVTNVCQLDTKWFQMVAIKSEKTGFGLGFSMGRGYSMTFSFARLRFGLNQGPWLRAVRFEGLLLCTAIL